MAELRQIELSQLNPSAFNPRKDFSPASLDELAASIAAQGVLQPLLVRPMGGGNKFQIIAGERRFRAAKRANLTTVPCIVKTLTDEAAAEAQIIENLQRSDISALEEAEGFQNLMKLSGTAEKARNGGKVSVKEIAARVGKSIEYVYGRLKLLDAVPEVRKQLAAGEIDPGHAIELVRLPAPQQKEALAAVHTWNGPMTVKDLREHIRENYHLRLSQTPWSAVRDKKTDPQIDDAKLNPSAGACEACPKRAANMPGYEAAKPDVCTDAACFRKKAEAFVQIQWEDHPELPLVAFPNGGASQQDYNRVPLHPLLPLHGAYVNLATTWMAKKCKSEETALVAADTDLTQVGKTIQVCRDKKCLVHKSTGYSRSSPSPSDRKRRDQAKQNEQLEDALLGKIARALRKRDLGAEEWRFLASEMDSWMDPLPNEVAQAFGLKGAGEFSTRWLKKQRARELAAYVFVSQLQSSAFGKLVEETARRHGVDVKAVRQSLAAPPAKLPTSAKSKAAATGKPAKKSKTAKKVKASVHAKATKRKR